MIGLVWKRLRWFSYGFNGKQGQALFLGHFDAQVEDGTMSFPFQLDLHINLFQ